VEREGRDTRRTRTPGTSFFPDVNVWVALSDDRHIHYPAVVKWLNMVPPDNRIVFSRHTQLGLLRLLTNRAVMGQQTLNLGTAWGVYDQWLQDPRVTFEAEPGGLDGVFRDVTEQLSGQQASKWVGDCYLLAYAKQSSATLVTFDKGLLRLARETGCSAIAPDLSEGAYA
jgi:toxin-antitoxin system PIN domain toxin